MPRGETLTSQTRHFILRLIDYFNREELNGGALLPLTSVHERVAEALNVSLSTVYNIKKEGQSIEGGPEKLVTPGTSRKRQKLKTEDLTEVSKSHIRNTVYHMYENREHITLNTLLDKFKEESTINISRTSLFRVLHNIGFSYKKDNNRRALMEKPSIVDLRIKFLRKYQENSTCAVSREVVFLDETWIFAHGAKKRSWQDTSVRSVKKACASEGKRFIILHAGHKGGFVPNASLIFGTKSKLADYHGDMDSKVFMKWIREKLVPNLEEPSLIIMDNASYHTVLLNKQPTTAWTKPAIIEWLQGKGIEVGENLFKLELLNLAKLQAEPPRYEVDEYLREQGHEVLRLPPYHCQFNAIELAWARAKTYYDSHMGENGFGNAQLLAMWEQSLECCTPEEWEKYVQHTERVIEEWTARQQLLDNIPEVVINVGSGESSDEDELLDDASN